MSIIISTLPRLSKPGAPRFVVLDDVTSEVLLDANGVGYRSHQAALNAWDATRQSRLYPQQKKSKNGPEEAQDDTDRQIKQWLLSHRAIAMDLAELHTYMTMRHDRISTRDVDEILCLNGVDEMPFSVAQLQCYIVQNGVPQPKAKKISET